MTVSPYTVTADALSKHKAETNPHPQYALTADVTKLLAGKSNVGHTHPTTTAVATSSGTTVHTHLIADVTGLQAALDAKAAASHTHGESGLVLADNTTNNATTSKHGFLQKLPGGTSTFLRADGAFASPTASAALFETSIAFTDGDCIKRVTVADASVTASTKIVGTIRRPDIADDSADRGYLYVANIVRVASGVFDVLVVCFGPGIEDTTELPPNETVKFIYSLAA